MNVEIPQVLDVDDVLGSIVEEIEYIFEINDRLNLIDIVVVTVNDRMMFSVAILRITALDHLLEPYFCRLKERRDHFKVVEVADPTCT